MPSMKLIPRLLCAAVLSPAIVTPLSAQNNDAPVEHEDELRVWHPVTISIRGPRANENDESPNPFLDVRLQVEFTSPSDATYNVPGFFDGDGSDGGGGEIWHVRFTPDEPGNWRYRASFRAGDRVAISLEPDAGEPLEADGTSGEFHVAPLDSSAAGFHKWGRLEYVGKHYLKFRHGPYWIRGGTDSPENFLAYAGFDDTPPSHTYAAHVEDWRPSDPDWGDGKGRGIIGAINSLADQHVNSLYFLTMNIGGDGNDVWPFAHIEHPTGHPDNDNLHYDISKLQQWETVFDHAQRRGVFLHFVFNEAERDNKRELDDGELGPERKLYYREMIARFGHHLALQWNLCEEYNLSFDFGPDRVRAFAEYIQSVDPYDHPIAVHSAGDPLEKLKFTFGDKRFSMTSIQLNQRPTHEVTEQFWRGTRDSGRPLPVSLDEFTVDHNQPSHIPVDDAEGHRRQKLWPTYLSGGMIEFILEGLLQVDSFKTPARVALWQYTWNARKFMEQELPFWEMAPDDSLVTGAATFPVGTGGDSTVPLDPQVFAKPGEVYAIYYPTTKQTGTLDLSKADGQFTQRWYNPRTGEFAGDPRTIQAGPKVPIGTPPSDAAEDWVCLIRR